MKLKQFTQKVKEQLNYYVYRLIDPRNGNTFYIGKGKNDRVFEHVKGALKNYNGKNHLQKIEEDEEDSYKLKTIKSILKDGFEVIHIIHRHGMDKDTALEVEAALIDAYIGLANKNGGIDNTRSAMNVEQIESLYAAEVINVDDLDNDKCVIFKLRESKVEELGDIYKTVRSRWAIGKQMIKTLQNNHHHILAVINGIVKGVYSNAKWSQAIESKRYEFDAEEANEKVKKKYLDKRIPIEYRKKGNESPFRYTEGLKK